MSFTTCPHAACQDRRRQYETTLRGVLRDPEYPRPVRFMAFRKLAQMRLEQIAYGELFPVELEGEEVA